MYSNTRGAPGSSQGNTDLSHALTSLSAQIEQIRESSKGGMTYGKSLGLPSEASRGGSAPGPSFVELEEQLRYFRRAVSELDSRRSEIAALHASTQSTLVQLRIEAAEARSLSENVRQTLLNPDELARRFGGGREVEDRVNRRLDAMQEDLLAEIRRQVQLSLSSVQLGPGPQVVEDMGRRMGELEGRIGEVASTVLQSTQTVDYLSRKAADEWAPASSHLKDVLVRLASVESQLSSIASAQRELEGQLAESRRSRDLLREQLERADRSTQDAQIRSRSDLEAIRQDVESVRTRVQHLVNNPPAAHVDTGALEAAVRDLRGEMERVKRSVESVPSTLEAIQSRTSDLERELSANRIAALKDHEALTGFDTRLTQTAAHVTALQDQISKDSEALTAFDARLEQQALSVAALQERVGRAEAQAEQGAREMGARVGQLEASQGETAARIGSLEGGLVSKVHSVQSDLESLRSAVQRLQEEEAARVDRESAEKVEKERAEKEREEVPVSPVLPPRSSHVIISTGEEAIAIKASIGALEERLSQLQSSLPPQLDDLTSRLYALEDSSSTALQSLQADGAALRSNCTSLDAKLQQLQRETAAANAALSQQLAGQSKDNKDTAEGIAQLRDHVADLDAKLQSLEETTAAALAAAAAAAHAQAKESEEKLLEIEEEPTAAADLERKLEEGMADLEKMRRELQSLQEKIEEEKERNRELRETPPPPPLVVPSGPAPLSEEDQAKIRSIELDLRNLKERLGAVESGTAAKIEEVRGDVHKAEAEGRSRLEVLQREIATTVPGSEQVELLETAVTELQSSLTAAEERLAAVERTAAAAMTAATAEPPSATAKPTSKEGDEEDEILEFDDVIVSSTAGKGAAETTASVEELASLRQAVSDLEAKVRAVEERTEGHVAKIGSQFEELTDLVKGSVEAVEDVQGRMYTAEEELGALREAQQEMGSTVVQMEQKFQSDLNVTRDLRASMDRVDFMKSDEILEMKRLTARLERRLAALDGIDPSPESEALLSPSGAPQGSPKKGTNAAGGKGLEWVRSKLGDLEAAIAALQRGPPSPAKGVPSPLSAPADSAGRLQALEDLVKSKIQPEIDDLNTVVGFLTEKVNETASDAEILSTSAKRLAEECRDELTEATDRLSALEGKVSALEGHVPDSTGPAGDSGDDSDFDAPMAHYSPSPAPKASAAGTSPQAGGPGAGGVSLGVKGGPSPSPRPQPIAAPAPSKPAPLVVDAPSHSQAQGPLPARPAVSTTSLLSPSHPSPLEDPTPASRPLAASGPFGPVTPAHAAGAPQPLPSPSPLPAPRSSSSVIESPSAGPLSSQPGQGRAGGLLGNLNAVLTNSGGAPGGLGFSARSDSRASNLTLQAPSARQSMDFDPLNSSVVSSKKDHSWSGPDEEEFEVDTTRDLNETSNNEVLDLLP